MQNVMRPRIVLCAVLLAALSVPAIAVEKKSAPRIMLEPRKVGPGDILVVTVQGVSGPVDGTFNNKKIYFNPSRDSAKAIVGIDLYTEPGTYDLEIAAPGATLKRTVRVVEKKYETQRLKLPKDMVELSPENEARVERERVKLAALWPSETGRVWSGNFINPLEGEVVTSFGLRRIINGIPKSSHSGMDISGNEGDEIRAPNDGIVALVDEQFYSGTSLILDHGQGIYTMFFHLSAIRVQPGQQVKKGDVIALVGSTGRSTGPHLHWGVRIQGARVDPQELIRLKLE